MLLDGVDIFRWVMIHGTYKKLYYPKRVYVYRPGDNLGTRCYSLREPSYSSTVLLSLNPPMFGGSPEDSNPLQPQCNAIMLRACSLRQR